MNASCLSVFAAVLLAGPPLLAQGITLRTGEVIIGEVVDVQDTLIKVEVTFPKVEVRDIPRDEIAPRSIYTVLSSRIDQNDGKAHLELAEICRKLGLYAFGISEAREASKRDPSLTTATVRMVREFRNEIAAQILRSAEDDFVDERVGAAQRAVDAILRDYEDTPAAKDARKLAKKMALRQNPRAREASVTEIEKAVKQVRKALDRAAKNLDAPAHGDMRHQRALQLAVARLEKVWEAVGDLVGPRTEPTTTTSAASPTDRLVAAQAELRKKLTAAYLALGTIYLERRALPDADEWCNKACDLDPENRRSHALHGLILQAKIVNGWGY